MRFLIDADLPRRTAGLLKTYGHEPVDVRDVGLGGASDEQVAAYARANRMCLLTGDFGFADIRNYPPDDLAALWSSRFPRTRRPTGSSGCWNLFYGRRISSNGCRAGSRSWSGATCASVPRHKPWVRSLCCLPYRPTNISRRLRASRLLRRRTGAMPASCFFRGRGLPDSQEGGGPGDRV